MQKHSTVYGGFFAVLFLLYGTIYGQESVSLPEIKPPTFDGETLDVVLPATLSDVRVGGAGRYVVLEIKSLRKLAVLDVSQAKLLGYIPMADDSTKFAVGATKLVMISTDSGVASRWDLKTQKKETTQTIDLGGAVKHVLLGSASHGPVIAATSGSHSGVPYSIDINTLKSEKLNIGSMRRGFSTRANVRIAANGTTMGVWESGVSPSGLQTYVKVGDKWEGHYQHDSVGQIVPSPDGRIIYTGAGAFTNELRTLGGAPAGRLRSGSSYLIPAVHGPFVLSVSGGTDLSGRNKQPEKVSLLLEGDQRALATVPNLSPVFGTRDDRYGRDGFTLDKKLIFVPDAQTIIQIARDKSKVTLVKFDHEAALKSSDIDFLIVRSRPPLSIKADESLSYQVQTLSKSSNISYSLDSAPKGMQLSKTGLLTWTPTTKSPRNSDIIISVADKSDQQIFHTFRLNVIGGSLKPDTQMTANVGTATQVEPIKTTPANIETKTKEIDLPATITEIVVGGGGRYLLAHLQSLKKVAVIDVSQAKIVKFLPASDDKSLVVAGATRAFVFSLNQGVITRYRLDTLERELTTTIPFPNAVQFAAMGSNSEGPIMLRTSVGQGALDSCKFHFLDTTTMKPLDVNWPSGHQPHSVYRDQNRIQVSSNGRVFCVASLNNIQLNGNNVSYLGGNAHSRSTMTPSPNGERFISGGKIYNSAMQPIGNQADNFGTAIPAVTGHYFISFAGGTPYGLRNGATKTSGKLYMFGDNRPLVTIQGLYAPTRDARYGMPNLNDRVFLIPNAKVIAVRESTNDRITLRAFDVETALKESGVDYLLVDSQAPSQAQLSSSYTYPLSVKSKRGDVEFKLDAAPQGMTISSDGKVMWQVPKELKQSNHNVIVSVSDSSGQSIYHTFTITIKEVQNRLAQKAKAAKELAVKQAAEEAQRKRTQLDEQRAKQRAQMQQQQAELAKSIQAKRSATKPATKPVIIPALRFWTDSSGKFKIEGRFVRIEDRKDVVVALPSGEEKTVPLNRLSSEDIYEAVKMDLIMNGVIPPSSESPFK